jgi:1,2-diacylglycerol 3-beta-glucosyltransferase
MVELESLLALLRGLGTVLLVAVDSVLACMSLYLLVVAAASFVPRRKRSACEINTTRFAILIPAHNEQLLVGELLQSIAQLDYPRQLYDVHVVADNCDDRTADIAAEAGVFVHERRDPSARGKGYALNWLLDRVLKPVPPGLAYDAFVILDADSIVAPNFLSSMAVPLAAGNVAVQGFNDISNPMESWMTSLRYIAFCLICYTRRLGMSALGMSVGLLGNGMCLSRAVVHQFRWDPTSITEDHELHARLLAAGVKVAFAPEAHVYSHMPTSLQSARSQNVRWEQGKSQNIRRHCMRLLVAGMRTRNWSMLALVMDVSVPPFSLTFASTLVAIALSLLVCSPFVIGLGAFSFVAQLLYALRGLCIMPVKSPTIYLALLYAPLFIAWKVGLYVAITFGSSRPEWIRTARTNRQ